MQQRSGFQEEIQLAKATAGLFGASDVLDARQQVGQGIGAGVGRPLLTGQRSRDYRGFAQCQVSVTLSTCTAVLLRDGGLLNC